MNMWGQMIAIKKKKQVELLEMKNTIPEIKNTPDEFNCWLFTIEEKISEFADMETETIKNSDRELWAFVYGVENYKECHFHSDEEEKNLINYKILTFLNSSEGSKYTGSTKY